MKGTRGKCLGKVCENLDFWETCVKAQALSTRGQAVTVSSWPHSWQVWYLPAISWLAAGKTWSTHCPRHSQDAWREALGLSPLFLEQRELKSRLRGRETPSASAWMVYARLRHSAVLWVTWHLIHFSLFIFISAHLYCSLRHESYANGPLEDRTLMEIVCLLGLNSLSLRCGGELCLSTCPDGCSIMCSGGERGEGSSGDWRCHCSRYSHTFHMFIMWLISLCITVFIHGVGMHRYHVVLGPLLCSDRYHAAYVTYCKCWHKLAAEQI